MSDDFLDRATRALRETTSDTPARPDLRAALLERARARQQPMSRRFWRWLGLGFGVFAVSTAMARVAQVLPELFDSKPEASERAAAPADKPGRARKAPARTPEPPIAAPPLDAPPAQPAPPVQSPAPAAGEPALVPAPRAAAAARSNVQRGAARPSRAAPRSAPALAEAAPHVPESGAPPQPTAADDSTPAAAAPAEAAAPAPAAGPAGTPVELELFRRALALHRRRDPRCLAAWDAYLRVAAGGVLSPEARYNRALCLVRLGRNAEARAALAPFADGAIGGFRRREARQLLDALK